MDQLHWILDQEGEHLSQASRGYSLPETPALIEFELSGRHGSIYRWQGRLLSYDGIGLDPATRTVPVRVVVDNPQEYIDEEGKVKHTRGATALVRGMFVRVQLLIEPTTKLVVIPARALQPGNRVFQFVPDESVLALGDEKSAAEMSDGKSAENSEANVDDSEPIDLIAEQTTGSSAFDPKAWEPGRVYVRSEINPVEALTMSEKAGSINNDKDSESGMWVCEVRGDVLPGGAFVVVSPMGSIDSKPLPVRADRSGMSEDTSAIADRDHGKTFHVPTSASRSEVLPLAQREAAQ